MRHLRPAPGALGCARGASRKFVSEEAVAILSTQADFIRNTSQAYLGAFKDRLNSPGALRRPQGTTFRTAPQIPPGRSVICAFKPFRRTTARRYGRGALIATLGCEQHAPPSRGEPTPWRRRRQVGWGGATRKERRDRPCAIAGGAVGGDRVRLPLRLGWGSTVPLLAGLIT